MSVASQAFCPPIVSVAGQRLEVRTIAGHHPEAPTVIFLHEGLGSVGQWRAFPDRFAAATGWPALIYSRRGYGASDPLPPPYQRSRDYLHHEALDVLPALLDHFDIRQPVLFGHSDGATIALIHAGAAASLGRTVHAVIVEAPHLFVEPVTLAGIRATREYWHQTDLRQRLARHHRHVDGAFLGWAETWLDPGFHDLNIESLLPGITCPVLAIQGEEDGYGTQAQIDRVIQQVSGTATRLMIPNCGHAPHREHPEIVLEAALRFLAPNPYAPGPDYDPASSTAEEACSTR